MIAFGGWLGLCIKNLDSPTLSAVIATTRSSERMSQRRRPAVAPKIPHQRHCRYSRFSLAEESPNLLSDQFHVICNPKNPFEPLPTRLICLIDKY